MGRCPFLGTLTSVQVDFNSDDIWFLEGLIVSLPQQRQLSDSKISLAVNRWLGAENEGHGKKAEIKKYDSLPHRYFGQKFFCLKSFEKKKTLVLGQCNIRWSDSLRLPLLLLSYPFYSFSSLGNVWSLGPHACSKYYKRMGGGDLG